MTRMTDERWDWLRSLPRLRDQQREEVVTECGRARSEEARLLKENAEKDATINNLSGISKMQRSTIDTQKDQIRALGDFLVGLAHVGPRGCAPSECGLCAALRLAGRLP